jgi:hypothetical protein
MKNANHIVGQYRHTIAMTAMTAMTAVVGAAIALISGCAMTGPSPIYSRLPPEQSGIPAQAQPLSPAERARYDAIDREVLADQERAIAADAAALYYRTYAPPVTVYGSYYSGGWGRGWGVGAGYPGWGWGW